MSAIRRAYTTERDLNNEQTTACRQHAGAARWAYNWGLARKHEGDRATGTSPSALELHRELNALKQTAVPWMDEVSTCAPQEALRHLDGAFAHFFRRCALKKHGTLKGTLGYPRRTTRKRGLGGFRLTGSIVSSPDAIRLPRLGRLRLKERDYLPTSGVNILSATVTERAGHGYVSVLVEQERIVPENSGPVAGVDLGVKALATLSDGTQEPEPTPRHLKSCLTKLKRTGSHNRRKAARCLGRLHRPVAHQRADTLHRLTSRLAKTKAVVVIEDLNVSGMLKNHRLAQAIGDVGFAESRRQLAYKAAWYGCRVVVASRWEPSSKTCSGCGWVDDDLTLADRAFRCENPARPDCGLLLDRDLHAAIHLEKLAGSSSDRQNACGGDGAGLGREAQVKPSSAKQEPDTSSAPV